MCFCVRICALETPYAVHFWFGCADTVKLHLIGMANHPDMPKIRIIRFFYENSYIDSLKFDCFNLQYVPVSKPFNHA